MDAVKLPCTLSEKGVCCKTPPEVKEAVLTLLGEYYRDRYNGEGSDIPNPIEVLEDWICKAWDGVSRPEDCPAHIHVLLRERGLERRPETTEDRIPEEDVAICVRYVKHLCGQDGVPWEMIRRACEIYDVEFSVPLARKVEERVEDLIHGRF